MEDNRRVLIPASDILSVIKAGTGRRESRGRERHEGEEQGP